MIESITASAGGGVFNLVFLPALPCVIGCLLKNPAVASAVAVGAYTIAKTVVQTISDSGAGGVKDVHVNEHRRSRPGRW